MPHLDCKVSRLSSPGRLSDIELQGNNNNCRERRLSMPKVPNVGEEKRYSVFVAAVYGIPVSDAPAGLSNNTHPTFARFFHSIFPS